MLASSQGLGKIIHGTGQLLPCALLPFPGTSLSGPSKCRFGPRSPELRAGGKGAECIRAGFWRETSRLESGMLPLLAVVISL